MAKLPSFSPLALSAPLQKHTLIAAFRGRIFHEEIFFSKILITTAI